MRSILILTISVCFLYIPLMNGQVIYETKNQISDPLELLRNTSGNYKVKNLSINSEASDFAPSVKDNMLTFTTARDFNRSTNKLKDWKNKPFLNLYSAQLNDQGDANNARKLPRELNTKTHESSMVFTKDGKTVYFTRNNSNKGNFLWDAKGVSRLKIYRATLRNGAWTDGVALPFNSDSYSVSHPTLNADETKLYFASDMPGTLGSSDIFSVDVLPNGRFGTPENLGPVINTVSRETFPYMTEDHVLYFASDGHKGLGGLDVFATRIADDSTLSIINLGQPINSPADDFSLIIDETTYRGYFASDREGGKGSDDIYSFQGTKPVPAICFKTIHGNAKDIQDSQPLSQALVTVLNKKELIAQTTTDAQGNFTLKIACNIMDYSIQVESSNYDMFSLRIPKDQSEKDPIQFLMTRKEPEPEMHEDLANLLNLEPIYFDLNSSYLNGAAMKELDKVATYLKDHPQVKINVNSHTDSRGSDHYNNWLSERRAKRTADYLISKGLDNFRVSKSWFGESAPINGCKNHTKCSELEHNKNRRSEFIVVEN